MLANHSDAIVVAVHNDQGNAANDYMAIPDGDVISNNLNVGFPSACVSRVRFSNGQGGTFVAAGFPSPGPGVVLSSTLEGMYDAVRSGSGGTGSNSPIGMLITQDYNSSSRSLSVTLRPQFSDSVLRYKLYYNVYLEEDGVQGTGQGYDQHIYGSYQIPQSIFYNYPGATSIGTGVWSMPSFTHNHVLRAVLGGLPGYVPTATDLPANYKTDGTEYPVTFTASIPSTWNDQHIKIIGFANYVDNNPNNSQMIMGASQMPMTAGNVAQTTATAIQPVNNAISIDNVYPNPSEGVFSADISFTQATTAYCNVTDITGKTLMTLPEQQFNVGMQTLNFNLSNLTPGIYFLNVKSAVGSYTQKIIISK